MKRHTIHAKLNKPHTQIHIYRVDGDTDDGMVKDIFGRRGNNVEECDCVECKTRSEQREVEVNRKQEWCRDLRHS